jgi:hypothetical protein
LSRDRSSTGAPEQEQYGLDDVRRSDGKLLSSIAISNTGATGLSSRIHSIAGVSSITDMETVMALTFQRASSLASTFVAIRTAPP